MHLLILDDDSMLRDLYSRLLKRHFDNIVAVASVDEAIAHMGTGAKVDMVLSDVMMPGKLGPEFHAWLVDQKNPLADKVVFATGGYSADIGTYLRSIPNKVLTKPVGRKELVSALC